MRARNKLNVKQVASLTHPGVYSDGGGLYLRVRQAGTKSWIFVSSVGGGRREWGLGSAMDVPLSKARERASELRLAILEGEEPRSPRRNRVQAVQRAVTFGAFAAEYIDSLEEGFSNLKHRQQWRSTVDTYAASIANKPVADVSTEDVLAILQPLWLEKAETARRLRGRIEKILDAARVRGLREGENPARLRGHLDLLLPRQSKVGPKHHAALPFAQLPSFVSDLRGREGTAARALELLILTAARTSEIISMTWGEIDLASALWTVPAERMKARAEHRVPLNEAALALLSSIRPVKATDRDLVFKSRGGSQLSNMAMPMLLRRLKHEKITVHGFRSTFRDWAGEKTDYARDVIEMALAHTITSKAERAYRRGRALEKRRALMADWGRYCGGG
jgi:integrase